MQTSQYKKCRIWEMKEDKYAKSQAKNLACAIIHMRDFRKNVLPKFIRLCMETPCWCPFEKSFPSRQLNAASRKSLEIQASSIAKRRTLWNRKFV